MGPRRVAVLAITTLVIAAVAGCGGSSRSTAPSSRVPTPAVERAGCTLGVVGGRFSTLVTSTGNRAGFFTMGTGPRGVLLVPQSDGDICQWLNTDEARQLVAAGYRVGLMDWVTPYESAVASATRLLRKAGATRVVAVGASRGGSYVLGTAAALHFVGVISLSGEGQLGAWDADARVRSYRGPLLLLGSRLDTFAPATATRVLARNHPGPEEVLVVPGAEHGIDLLDGAYGAQVTSRFTRFLARTMPRQPAGNR